MPYDDFCDHPQTDGICKGCRGLRVWQLLIDNAAPRDCCRATGRSATKEEAKLYNLAGQHHWIQCIRCRRVWTRQWQLRQEQEGLWT